MAIMGQMMNQKKVKEHLARNPRIYVSITGLKLKGFWKFFPFFLHAIPSRMQAERSPGVLYSGVNRINGIFHTLSAWENKEFMKKYAYSGAHLKAIKAFRSIATGKTFGFETDHLPSWEEVHEIWKQKGKEY